MRLKLDEFFEDPLLFQAKNLFLEEFSEYIRERRSNFATEIIRFEKTFLEISITGRRLKVKLDSIPDFMQEDYQNSSIIEYNKYAASLHLLDLNKPPKFYATRNEIERCECYLIGKIIEKAILLIFNLTKLSEFQFYTYSGNYLGVITRIRLNHDLITNTFSIYDCLIFTEHYKIEKKDIATLKDILKIVEKEDYCVQNLPEIINELEGFTKFPFIEAEDVISFEKLNRVKIPKRPIFHRIPFLVWTQQQKAFYVPDESISELVY
jgi:hypothetical protein